MSVDHLSAASFAGPSRERAFLDRWSFAGSVVLAVFGVLAVTSLSSEIPGLAGGLAVFFGVFLAWGYVLYLRLLPQAREALDTQPVDMLFERRYRLSKWEPWRARLWVTDGQERPLAWFGSVQWATPLFMTTQKVAAKVYGAPKSGSAVVVSCSQGVLVGRINLSHVDDSQGASVPPRGLGWLFRPIRLPFSRH
jgi:hypothetical protein